MKQLIKKASIATISLLIANLANAVPITSDLTITGTITFDSDPLSGSSSAVGNASQTATMKSLLGGTLSTSSVDNLTVTGTNPHGGQLIDINDGIGLIASVSSDGIGEVPIFVFDYDFGMSNASLTEDYTISFAINYDTSVDSSADTEDAFIDNRVNLYNPAEFFFSELKSDTSDSLGGNEKNGVSTGNLGGVETESGLFSFDIMLLAGQTTNFTGEVKLDGQVFDQLGMMNGFNDSFIYLSGVTGSSPLPPPTPPTDVPTPSTPVLLLMGMVFLMTRRIRS